MHHCLQVGYHIGAHAPGHKHPRDYWQVGHHVLLAHAAAVKRFRQTVPDGKIGIVANSDFFEPLTSSAADQVIEACVPVCASVCGPTYHPSMSTLATECNPVDVEYTAGLRDDSCACI